MFTNNKTQESDCANSFNGFYFEGYVLKEGKKNLKKIKTTIHSRRRSNVFGDARFYFAKT